MLKEQIANKSLLIEENEKLKNALRTVFSRQKIGELELEKIKSENEKLNSSVRKQVTTIPELQIQNKVLQKQLKSMIQDLHTAEKMNEDVSEKFKNFKLSITRLKRKLIWSRSFLFITFVGATTLIWQSYRDTEENRKVALIAKKVSKENEALVAQNKIFYEERETFQTTINKKYQEQIENLNSRLVLITYEKNALNNKYSEAIESFKEQTNTLKQEQMSLLNLTKNEYETKISNLINEKIVLNNRLLESETKNREIALTEPTIKEAKHIQYLKSIESEKAIKPTEQKFTPKIMTSTIQEFNQTQEPLPPLDTNSVLEQKEAVPFKLKASPF